MIIVPCPILAEIIGEIEGRVKESRETKASRRRKLKLKMVFKKMEKEKNHPFTRKSDGPLAPN